MKSNNLKPYTLILRDVERALPLKEILDTKNINVLIEPIYQIAPIKFKPINFIEYQALLITSVNTIKMLIKTTSKEEIKTIKTYCVGKVTEKYALDAGFNCVKTNDKSGKTLADEVIKKNKKNDKKILIVGAENIAYDPLPNFKRAGINAQRIIIYKKIANKKLSNTCSSLLKKKSISNVIIYSPETATIFLHLIKYYDTTNINVICLGIKTKKILKNYNWKKIQVLDNVELINFANNIIKSNMI